MKSLGVISSFCAVAMCAVVAGAATVNVGPSRTYTTVQAGINAASPGDTVAIDAGTYTGDAAGATWTTDNLTIKANSGRPVLDFTGSTAGGLVINSPAVNVTIDSLELVHGTQAVSSHASGTTTVKNCSIHSSGNGFHMFGGASAGAVVVVENCHVYDASTNGGTMNWVEANVSSFTLKGSWLHNGYNNYFLKVSSAKNYILYNRIGDEPGWTNVNVTDGSVPDGQMINFLKGGLTYVIGNVIQNTTDAGSGRDVINYNLEGGLGAGYSQQLYAVYNTVFLRRAASTTCFYFPAVTTAAFMADNVLTQDQVGQLFNGSVVNNSAMINSNLVLYPHQGNNPLAVHRFMYDANGYDGDGNAGTLNTDVNWDLLNARPVDPNTFPFGAACSNTTSKMPLANGYQTVLSPGAGVQLLVPGSNPLALPATGEDGTSLTPTSQYSNMPQVAGVAGGTETRSNATDAIGAYAFAVPPPPNNHQPVGTITSTMPPFIYEGWTVNMTATATDQDVGQTLGYQWSQTAGQGQALTAPTALNTSFTVAAKSLTSRANETLTFQFVATDNGSPVMSSTPVTASVTCYMCGDIDHDNAVILADLKLLVASWNTTPTSGNWNLAADLDGSNSVNLGDLKLLVANWNRSLP